MIANHGIQISQAWLAEIQKWQHLRTLRIDGHEFARIPFTMATVSVLGEPPLCGDCAVEAGLLHVAGCENERCPKCGGQIITCGCRRTA